MKISYLLECYDVIVHQTLFPISNSNKAIFEEFRKLEKKSFRIYEIEIDKKNKTENVIISQTRHSFHPDVQLLELKSIFQLSDYLRFVPELKKRINFTGENIFIAPHPNCELTFYVYEKCSISEIGIKELNFLYISRILTNENIAIKRAIKEQVFKYKSNDKIEHFIHKIQLALECQLQLIVKHLEPKTKKELYEFTPNYEKEDCLKCIFSNVENLLLFIDKEFSEFLNVHSMVPYHTLLMQELEIASKIEYVRNSLLAMVIEKELLQIIFEPIHPLADLNSKEKISYHQFNYSKKYIVEIAKFIYENPAGINEPQWYNWLLEMQVNSFVFFDLKTTLIKQQINESETDNDKLELMFQLLKDYKRTKNGLEKSYIENLPQIKLQIYSWLKEEIEYLNRKRKRSIKIKESSLQGSNPNKIHLNLSVAQLAYVLNLLIKSGVIKNNNIKEVLQVATDIFKTDSAENISFDSLRSKYYNSETSTIEAVREKIENLLNYTKL